jgi:GxxExxY protein
VEFSPGPAARLIAGIASLQGTSIKIRLIFCGVRFARSGGMRNVRHTDELTAAIIGASITVHTAFGPGLLERIYVPPLVWELEDRGLRCVTHVPVNVEYRGRTLENAYFIDLLVEGLIVVEVKCIAAILPVHLAQTITYVRLAGKPAGLLINFNVKRLVDGVRRVVNDDPSRKQIAVASE